MLKERCCLMLTNSTTKKQTSEVYKIITLPFFAYCLPNSLDEKKKVLERFIHKIKF